MVKCKINSSVHVNSASSLIASYEVASVVHTLSLMVTVVTSRECSSPILTPGCLLGSDNCTFTKILLIRLPSMLNQYPDPINIILFIWHIHCRICDED